MCEALILSTAVLARQCWHRYCRYSLLHSYVAAHTEIHPHIALHYVLCLFVSLMCSLTHALSYVHAGLCCAFFHSRSTSLLAHPLLADSLLKCPATQYVSVGQLCIFGVTCPALALPSATCPAPKPAHIMLQALVLAHRH